MPDLINLIKDAQARLRGVVSPTPLVFSASLSKALGFECHLKLENLQKTGSFKARGAYNRIAAPGSAGKKAGVITASSGNHGQGVAWAATLLGLRSTVVMPETTPIIKYMAAKGYGAEVVFHGGSFDEALGRAIELAVATGAAFIPPFDDELVMAGQGTIGLEIMDALPDVDAVAVPIGGGGLISGIASAIKSVKPNARVIGAQAEASRSCSASLEAGRPVSVEKSPSIADGIAVKRVGDKTFPIIKRLVDEVCAVGEDAIAAAILQLLERKKLVVEGAGAVPLAAAMSGKLPQGIKKAVFVISGGNIDVTTLDRVIRLGLLKEGRVMKVSTVIPDAPGSLARLTNVLASQKANILHVVHERDSEDAVVGSTRIEVILEVESHSHGAAVRKALAEAGY
ncbi:MAG: threonine ammonia-lyase [Deltaproteobacteria bacterium]|nr:threonine ammonia-lyase [Deltaproteobacteria bacterium]